MRKTASVAVLAFVALGSLPASGETLTLQKGVAGYGGCTDSYIQADGYADDNNTNYGTQSDLVVGREHYLYY